MIVTTTPTVEGQTIKEYIKLVSGAGIYNAGGLIGGGYTNKGQSMYFQSAVETATNKMISNAPTADAIVGVQVVIGSSSIMNQVIVTVTGTAVRFQNGGSDAPASSHYSSTSSRPSNSYGTTRTSSLSSPDDGRKYITCPCCGEDNPKGKLFCIHCGEKL